MNGITRIDAGLESFFAEGESGKIKWMGIEPDFSLLDGVHPKTVKFKRKLLDEEQALKTISWLLAFVLSQSLEMQKLRDESRRFIEAAFFGIVEKQTLSFEEVVKRSPALQVFIQNKKLSDATKNLILKNKEKIERLYEDGKFQSNLDKFKGIIKIKDKKIAEDFFE